MKEWLRINASVFIGSLIGIAIAYLLLTVAKDHAKRVVEQEQQQAEFQAELERQCALAWPLQGSNYDECINKQARNDSSH